MKKFLIVVVLVVTGLVMTLYLGGKTRLPGGATLADAAYSVRNAETTDATRFLVGKFRCEDGTNIVFDGFGGLRHIGVNFSETPGSYQLTQAADGAAVVRMELDSAPTLDTFKLLSPDGLFSLTDAAGRAQTFTLTM